MKKELSDIVEAARSLGVVLTGRDGPGCVRISGAPDEFPARLMRLQVAVEAYDRSAGGGAENDGAAAKAALDALFRWMAEKNIDLREPMAVVEAARSSTQQGQKRKKGYVILPRFAPNGWKKRRGYKPKLRMLPDATEQKLKSMDAVKGYAFDCHAAAMMLGAVLPRPPSPSQPAGV